VTAFDAASCISFGQDSFASSRNFVRCIYDKSAFAKHTLALAFQYMLKTIRSVSGSDIRTLSRTMKLTARADISQIFVLYGMKHKRLQFAKMVLRLEFQLLHGSGEAKPLLIRDKKHSKSCSMRALRSLDCSEGSRTFLRITVRDV
jgi:hypothetical protein